MTTPLLQVKDLSVWFHKTFSMFGKPLTHIRAVNGVTFNLHAGETLGLVGESGSGKSTTGYAIMRALKPTSGSVHFSPDGKKAHDLAQLEQAELRPLRRHFQLIFQDPFSSLNPRMTVRDLIAEPLKVNKIGTPKEQTERVKELMAEVGLNPAFLNRYPHAFSGGQRQRIVIARALTLNPKLIICDEAVSALDVSVQAQILNLLMELKEKHKLAYIFIGHDLEVVRHIADRVAVMYAGRLVEDGTTENVLSEPLHPYTEALLATAPRPDPHYEYTNKPLSGEVPNPANLPSGCVFHPRCPEAKECCKKHEPQHQSFDGKSVRCLKHEDGYKSFFSSDFQLAETIQED